MKLLNFGMDLGFVLAVAFAVIDRIDHEQGSDHEARDDSSKEQVADMLKRMLHIPESDMLPFMDATDGLAAAYCHYLQMGRPTLTKEYSGWKDFINKNPDKIKR